MKMDAVSLIKVIKCKIQGLLVKNLSIKLYMKTCNLCKLLFIYLKYLLGVCYLICYWFAVKYSTMARTRANPKT